MTKLFEFFVEYPPEESGGVELLADSYRNFSLKREEQESRGASQRFKKQV